MDAGTLGTPIPSLPRLGQPAPAFQAETTHGTIRLADFAGSWLILFSHPADFTPVCTTELVAFAQIAPELRKRNVELLGLSIDSTYSHIAWVRAIEQHFKTTIPFHLLAVRDPAFQRGELDTHFVERLLGPKPALAGAAYVCAPWACGSCTWEKRSTWLARPSRRASRRKTC